MKLQYAPDWPPRRVFNFILFPGTLPRARGARATRCHMSTRHAAQPALLRTRLLLLLLMLPKSSYRPLASPSIGASAVQFGRVSLLNLEWYRVVSLGIAGYRGVSLMTWPETACDAERRLAKNHMFPYGSQLWPARAPQRVESPNGYRGGTA